MNEHDNRIKIGFSYTDEFGNEFNQKTCATFDERTELDAIGEQLNVFLKQISFPRHNDYMLMEDLTEDELDYLHRCLEEYRYGNTQNSNTMEESDAC